MSALIYALVLDSSHEILEKQMRHLQAHADTGVARLTENFMDSVKRLEPRLRLALIDLAIPALRQLSPEQYRRFRENLNTLIDMDGEVSPFEWSLQKIVLHNLDMEFHHKVPPLGRYGRLSKLRQEITLMLSFLAHNTHESHMQQLHAFQAAVRELEMEDLQLIPLERIELEQLDRALKRLAQLKPLLKPRLLKACAACVAADNEITATEMELLRAFSSLLDCPLPPLSRQ
jgi:hypothetical protein